MPPVRPELPRLSPPEPYVSEPPMPPVRPELPRLSSSLRLELKVLSVLRPVEPRVSSRPPPVRPELPRLSPPEPYVSDPVLRPVPYESEPVEPPRPLSSLRAEEERESAP